MREFSDITFTDGPTGRRATFIHDSTVVICDGRGVLLPSKGRNREE